MLMVSNDPAGGETLSISDRLAYGFCELLGTFSTKSYFRYTSPPKK